MPDKSENKIYFIQPTFTGLSMIIPCKDEEGAIGHTVDTLHQHLEPLGMEYEIIVVDDGSRDQSQAKALEAGAKVVVHRKNLGYGNAIMNGIAQARYPVVGIIDGDGTYPAEKLPQMLDLIGQYDMVVGQRCWDSRNTSRLGLFLRRILAMTIRVVGGVPAADFNSGFRLFHKDGVLLYRHMLCPTFSFTTTLTLLFAYTHRSIYYLPIDYGVRIGSSKVRMLRDAITTFIYVFFLSNSLKAYRPALLVLVTGLVLNLLVMLLGRLFGASGAAQLGWHLIFSTLTLSVLLSMVIMPITKILFLLMEQRKG